MELSLYLLHRVYQKDGRVIQQLMGVFEYEDRAVRAGETFVAQFRATTGQEPDAVPQVVRFRVAGCEQGQSVPAHVYVCARQPTSSFGPLAQFCDAYCIATTWSAAQAALATPPCDAVTMLLDEQDKVDTAAREKAEVEEEAKRGDESAEAKRDRLRAQYARQAQEANDREDQDFFQRVSDKTVVFLMPLNAFRWRCMSLEPDEINSSAEPCPSRDDARHLHEWLETRLYQLDDEREHGRAPHTSNIEQPLKTRVDWPGTMVSCQVATLHTLQGALAEVEASNTQRPLIDTTLAALVATDDERRFCLADMQALLVPAQCHLVVPSD
jgi:hypothetical protein